MTRPYDFVHRIESQGHILRQRGRATGKYGSVPFAWMDTSGFHPRTASHSKTNSTSRTYCWMAFILMVTLQNFTPTVTGIPFTIITYHQENDTRQPCWPWSLLLATPKEKEGVNEPQQSQSYPSTVAYADSNSCSHRRHDQKHTWDKWKQLCWRSATRKRRPGGSRQQNQLGKQTWELALVR